MSQFAIHPHVYATGNSTGLIAMLERVWVRGVKPGHGTIFMAAGFSWSAAIKSLERQKWDFYQPSLTDAKAIAWKLLYDEFAGDVRLEEPDEVTMIVTLSHSDTARINASPGSAAGKGTQYFWL